MAQAASKVDGMVDEELKKINMDACNNTILPAGSFQRLGPAQLFESLGPLILLPLYCSLAILATFLWCYAIYWRRRVVGGGVATTLLQLLPVLNLTLTLPLFLSPPTLPLVSLIQVMTLNKSRLTKPLSGHCGGFSNGRLHPLLPTSSGWVNQGG